MGFPPPKDAPSPEEQDQSAIDAGFEPSPTGSTLCGFGFPRFNLSINLPGFAFPDIAFPNLSLAIGLNCDLSEPFTAEFGGGRVPNYDADQDDAFVEA